MADVEELPVVQWLKGLRLPQYVAMFVDDGYEEMGDMEMIDAVALKEMGVSKPGHRTRILTALKKHFRGVLSDDDDAGAGGEAHGKDKDKVSRTMPAHVVKRRSKSMASPETGARAAAAARGERRRGRKSSSAASTSSSKRRAMKLLATPSSIPAPRQVSPRARERPGGSPAGPKSRTAMQRLRAAEDATKRRSASETRLVRKKRLSGASLDIGPPPPTIAEGDEEAAAAQEAQEAQEGKKARSVSFDESAEGGAGEEGEAASAGSSSLGETSLPDGGHVNIDSSDSDDDDDEAGATTSGVYGDALSAGVGGVNIDSSSDEEGGGGVNVDSSDDDDDDDLYGEEGEWDSADEEWEEGGFSADGIVAGPLPAMVLRVVFRHLDISTLLRTATLVHSSWNELINTTRSLFHTFDASQLPAAAQERLTDDVLSDIVDRWEKLKVLNLTGAVNITDEGVEMISAHCPLLECVTLDNNTKITNRGLRIISIMCPSLRELTIRNCKLATSLRHVSRNCQLYKLVLDKVATVTGSIVADMAKASKRLRHLRIIGCCRNTYAPIAKSLKACRALVEVQLEIRDKMTPQFAAFVRTLAGNCPRVTTFALDCYGGQSVTDAGVVAITEQCGKIRRLKLSGCVELSDKAMDTVSMAYKDLEELDVQRSTMLTDTSIDLVSKRCPKLTKIRIAGCEMVSGAILKRYHWEEVEGESQVWVREPIDVSKMSRLSSRSMPVFKRMQSPFI